MVPGGTGEGGGEWGLVQSPASYQDSLTTHCTSAYGITPPLVWDCVCGSLGITLGTGKDGFALDVPSTDLTTTEARPRGASSAAPSAPGEGSSLPLLTPAPYLLVSDRQSPLPHPQTHTLTPRLLRVQGGCTSEPTSLCTPPQHVLWFSAPPRATTVLSAMCRGLVLWTAASQPSPIRESRSIAQGHLVMHSAVLLV